MRHYEQFRGYARKMRTALKGWNGAGYFASDYITLTVHEINIMLSIEREEMRKKIAGYLKRKYENKTSTKRIHS